MLGCDNNDRKFKMKFTNTCITFAGAMIIVMAGAVRPQSATAATAEATAQPKQSEIASADQLFQAGKFSEAGKLYSKIVAQNPKDDSAILQLVGLHCFPTGSMTRRNGCKRQ